MGKMFDQGLECPGTAQLPAEPITWRGHIKVRGTCPRCGKNVALNAYDFIRSHKPKKSA